MKELLAKKQLAFVIEDEDSEIFGHYFNTQIFEKYGDQKTDNKTFHFNLQTKNNRLDKPMKFEIKDLNYGGIWLCKNSDIFDDLIILGEIRLKKENNKNKSFCEQYEENFNYHGIINALCGKTYDYNSFKGECFTPKRILVIQMK